MSEEYHHEQRRRDAEALRSLIAHAKTDPGTPEDVISPATAALDRLAADQDQPWPPPDEVHEVLAFWRFDDDDDEGWDIETKGCGQTWSQSSAARRARYVACWRPVPPAPPKVDRHDLGTEDGASTSRRGTGEELREVMTALRSLVERDALGGAHRLRAVRALDILEGDRDVDGEVVDDA